MIKSYSLFALAFLFTLTVSFGQTEEYARWALADVQNAIDHCEQKALVTLGNLDSYKKSPRTIHAGEKHWNTKPTGGWTSGFWAGILWYVYEGTGNKEIKTAAEKFTEEIETILARPVKSHDMGFIFNCSYGNGYRLTKKETYKKTLLIAADSLSHLFNPDVGTILSWPAQVHKKVFYPHNTIIDNMMNLELLFEASKLGTNNNYYKMADSHAKVTANNQIRPNNTVYHVLVYDDKTGKAIQKVTHQGYSDESVWARGQAWSIYGYTMSYRETGNKKYLKTAEKLAEAYLKRLSNDYVPFWDFDDPSIPNTVKDASAASIVASAFLELSEHQSNTKEKNFYRAEAEKMLHSLTTPNYLSGSKNEAFLLHSTGNKPKNGEVDIPIIYADYYFIEALVRLKKILESERAGNKTSKE
jgi:unsaturated chondroitin disaccharide hydrolase